MLEIILPVTLVPSPIHVNIDSISIGFVILPLTFKYIAINMPKLSFATGFVVLPVAFIASTIRPYLHSIAMLHIS
jgi:hypothetical protein